MNAPPQKGYGKKPGLFTRLHPLAVRLGYWWTFRLGRKGAYVKHYEDFGDGGHFPYSDTGGTFSVEEDRETCNQVLLKKDMLSSGFDRSPLISTTTSRDTTNNNELDPIPWLSRAAGHWLSTSSSTGGAFFNNNHIRSNESEDSDDQSIVFSRIDDENEDVYKFDDDDDDDLSGFFARRTHQDSIQASLESLDSLTWSYLDEEDEEGESYATPRIANMGEASTPEREALGEHVYFLRLQMQPRSVELVWNDDEPYQG